MVGLLLRGIEVNIVNELNCRAVASCGRDPHSTAHNANGFCRMQTGCCILREA